MGDQPDKAGTGTWTALESLCYAKSVIRFNQ